MITTMVGCDTPKTNWSKLLDEEKIDKVLQSFERMKNGEIHIVGSMYADVIDPKEGEDPVYKYEAEFTGVFELRPDHVSESFHLMVTLKTTIVTECIHMRKMRLTHSGQQVITL